MRDFIKPQLRQVRYIEFQYSRFPNHSQPNGHTGNGHSSLVRRVKIPDDIAEDNIPDRILDPNAWGYKTFCVYEGVVEVNGIKIMVQSHCFNISQVTCYGQRTGTIEEFEKDVFTTSLDSALARSYSWKNVLQMVNGNFFVFDKDYQFRQVLPRPKPPQS